MALYHFTLPLIDYILILRKKLWLFLLIFALVLGITAYATFTQQPVYRATCKIRYKKDTPSAFLSTDPFSRYLSPYYNTVSFETEKHVITSKPVAKGVVEKLKLASPEQPTLWKSWVNRVKGSLSVSQLPETRIYLITSLSSDPELAQKIANTTAEIYIRSSLEAKQESAAKLLSVLTSQIKDLKGKIQESEMAKIDYVDRTGEVPIGENNQAVVTEQTFDTSRKVRLLNDLRAILVKKEIERQELLNKYKEKHPRVREIDRQITVLKEKISAENKRIIQGHKEAIEYGLLVRDAQANQEQYKILITKLKELNLSDDGLESGIEIVERAETPRVPVSPKKKKNLTLGALLGLVLGLGAVLVTEYFDPSLQTPDEVENYLDLPVLASIPRMIPPSGLNKNEGENYLFRVVDHRPRGTGPEMFKLLRTHIKRGDFPEESLSLLLTSSGPKEGKTTVVSNLAVTFAQADFKTVLIDADLRRPAAGRIFNLEEEAGLTEYLKGEISVDRIIYSSDIENLSVIPAGEPAANPAELLEAPRLPELIENLKKTFDRIVIDSPPAGALADASIIGALTDAVILVCFAGHIDKKFIFRTKLQLEKGGAKIYGVVLNYIELKLRSYRHYYQSIYKYVYR